MASALNYQLTIFGSYSVEPSPEMVTKLMNAINAETNESFLPNLISGQKVEIPTNRITTINNLGYTTQNQKINISILNERVDVIYRKVDDIELDINYFFNLAVKALTAIMNTCSLKAYRLAVNVQALANNLDDDQIAELGRKLITTAAYYDEKPLVEWSTRINSISEIDMDGVTEKLNTILNITTAKSAPTQTSALIYHIDINTLPQLRDLRFNPESLPMFVAEVNPIIEGIISDAERLISFDR